MRRFVLSSMMWCRADIWCEGLGDYKDANFEIFNMVIKSISILILLPPFSGGELLVNKNYFVNKWQQRVVQNQNRYKMREIFFCLK